MCLMFWDSKAESAANQGAQRLKDMHSLIKCDNVSLYYLLLNDEGQDIRQLEVINLDSFRTESIRLGSPPDHIGLIPNDGNPRIYISQEHPVGRMTFIDETNDEIKTVTGFELNSLID